MKYAEKLETKDLVIGKAKMEDLESLYNNYWKSEVSAKYMLWTPQKNLDEARDRLIRTINYQKDNFAYLIYYKETMEAIGQVAFWEIEEGVYEDKGLGMGERFVGRGFGKQVLNCMLRYMFEQLGAKMVYCSCHTDNIPSAKMQQSCGMKYSHSYEVTREKDGLTYKSDNYVITRDEWFELNK
ncbi:MAG: GNAT family N-acetyltransferase [Clostridiales bacterium]|nr:GNAT family N-acetyltransferase [Clostridiales bacterium]